MCSGGNDCVVRFWEVTTGRCLKSINVQLKVFSIAWCPNPTVTIVAIAWLVLP
jgi:ribosome biogenesis protein ERB1